MKSLRESLFDKDLVSNELPIRIDKEARVEYLKGIEQKYSKKLHACDGGDAIWSAMDILCFQRKVSFVTNGFQKHTLSASLLFDTSIDSTKSSFFEYPSLYLTYETEHKVTTLFSDKSVVEKLFKKYYKLNPAPFPTVRILQVTKENILNIIEIFECMLITILF